MYLTELRSDVSQGDIFGSISLISVVKHANDPTFSIQLREGRGILITHDCEFDKPANHSVLIAEIRDLSEVAIGNQGHIRQYRTRNTFYIEPLENRLPESYVDFRYLTQLPKERLVSLAHSEKRITSLTDEARLALQRQIAIFFGYGR